MHDVFDFFTSYSYLFYLVLLNVILALSVYITLMAGQLSLASIGFMAIGAYSSALLAMNVGLPYPLSMICAALISGTIAVLVCMPVLRLKGVYLAITTVGFGELVRFIALNSDYLGGAMGLSGIPPATETWHLAVFLLILIYGFRTLQRSRHGRALVAIGRDEVAAKTMGIPTTQYKVAAFTAGAMMASVAGSFAAHHTAYLSPGEFTFTHAVLVLIFVVFGGLRNYWGPVLGAIVLTLLPEVFRFLHEWRMIIYGISVLLVVVFIPDGLLEFGRFFRHNRNKAGRSTSGPTASEAKLG